MAVGAVYDSFGIFTFLMVTALFSFAAEKGQKVSLGEVAQRIVKEISAGTLGVYVMHIGLMEALKLLGVHSMMIPNVIGIPVYAALCFAICLLAAAILRRIPVIGKYLC